MWNRLRTGSTSIYGIGRGYDEVPAAFSVLSKDHTTGSTWETKQKSTAPPKCKRISNEDMASSILVPQKGQRSRRIRWRRSAPFVDWCQVVNQFRRMKLSSCFVFAGVLVACALGDSSHQVTAIPTYSAKIIVDAASTVCTVITATGLTQLHRAIKTPADIFEQSVPRQNRASKEELLLLGDETDAQKIVEIFGGSVSAVEARILERCPNGVNPAAPAAPKPSLRGVEAIGVQATSVIKKIVDSGDPSNRIDVVFMGDGYTASEQTKFFDDIKRLTNEMFTGDTFAQYLPLFNIWAAYLPSTVSGIGTGGTPKNTVFGLYRDGTELRGVYVTNAAKARELCASVGTNACDFPSLIGNDDFYGGLGGEFVISTRSVSSGTVVLRHEMGHNFGVVGEEYDGGQVYSGANSVKSVSGVTWKHWLTNPNSLVEQKAAQLYQKHIWYNLQQGAYTISFTSTGAYKRWYILISASGVDTDDSLTVTLDGKPLSWKSNGLKDRSFYSWTSSTAGFTAGTHTLVIKGGGSFTGSIIKQLCNAVIYEYKDESEYKLDDPDYIGIYPTYDISKSKSYRPNNEKCLMRNMTSSSFCAVCQENMWLKFMARIEFIDDVVVSGKSVEVKLIPLGQLRPATDGFIKSNPKLAAAEKYTIQWLKSGVEVTKFRDQTKVDLTGEATGQWTVRANFTTPTVRLDPNKYMLSEKTFTI
ncbi:hypothetical protein FI667_g16488, partial [Globisporangium splendens]